MIDPRPHLRALAEATAPGGSVLVPRDWVLAIVGEVAPAPVEVDLTVAQVAAMFSRAPSTILGWIDAGLFQQAYKNRGREWRIPKAAVRDFQERQRSGRSDAPAGRPTSPRTGASRGSLSDWRNIP